MVSRGSSDKKNWDHIFMTLVKILHTKQDQLESLVKDRKIIESSIKSIKQNWVCDVRNHEDQLSLMMAEIETMKMMRLVETAKFSLLSGLKETDRSLCNLKLEQTLDELNDFKAWFDFLTLNANMHKESGFTDKLKRKDDDIAQAYTRISSLITYQEQLQSSNHDKEETISSLKAKVAEMVKNSIKKDEEISKLKQDLESLKMSCSLAQVLTQCTQRDKGRNGNTVGPHITTNKKEKTVASSTSNEQGSKNSKRKREKNKTPVSVSEIPKLFTSYFRVPKLKSTSSGAI